MATIYTDDQHPYSPPSIVIKEVLCYAKKGSSITKQPISLLDIGCNKGYLGKRLKEQVEAHCTGVDIDKDDIFTAGKTYDTTRVLDLNNIDSVAQFLSGKKFDFIFLLDVLEHLINPEELLNALHSCLYSHSKIFISLPNVANFSVRFPLLLGYFRYRNAGILDQTHFHLYTAATGKELIQASHFKVDKLQFASNRFGKLISYLPFIGTLLGYNLVYTVSTIE